MQNEKEDRKLDTKILDQKIITEPEAVPILFHSTKQKILEILIEREMTIIDLKRSLGLNPGTIKRHLDDLIEAGLVVQVRTMENKYKVVMRFFRSTAKCFIVNLRWP